jgi:hypothetical protein
VRLVLALLIVALAAAPAHAEFVMCIGGQGAVPAPATVIPPRAHIAYYSDRSLRLPDKLTATIGGTAVKVKTRTVNAPPFRVLVTEIESDRTGELVVTYDGFSPIKYTVKPVAMPKEVAGTIGRAGMPTASFARTEVFDGLVIRLTEGTIATIAHVKLRTDEKTPWTTLDVPMFMAPGESRQMIRVGQFECQANVNLALLARGFDIEASVTLIDGTTRKVANVAPRMTLPERLPAQPRPKNQRAP